MHQKISKFFLQGYISKKYYWEFIQMFRKFSLILANAFFKSQTESAIVSAIMTVFLFLHIFHQPYDIIFFNTLETISLTTCMITVFSIIYLERLITESSRNFIIFLILLSNCFFLFMWMIKYWIVFKKNVKETMDIIKDFPSNLKKKTLKWFTPKNLDSSSSFTNGRMFDRQKERDT